MKKGIVFDLKEFAVYDGPGLRQTVFLKGCPLHCNWCHNPEGLLPCPQLMVSTASCIHCGACEKACEIGYELDLKEGKIREKGKCITCGRCVIACPLHLRKIVGKEMTSDELVELIRKDSGYYEKYKGGVTFSGGEPLMQSKFLIEVLDKIKDLHKTIETSGFAEKNEFLEVIKRLDFVIMDIKIFDKELHKKYIGVDNTKILENAKLLCEGNIPFIIRIPVIPGVNDNEDNFRKTAEWVKGAKMLQKIELLPYHKTAGAKYSMVGKEYKPMFDVEKQVIISKKIFDEYGIRSEVL